MKAILVDDERPAREEMRRLLKAHPEVEIVGEAAGASEALEVIREQQPDILFLDIQMPEGNGFDLLEALPPPHPNVIFTTAFDQFALRAFEANALDYLLKPVNPQRLAKTLEKLARQQSSEPQVPQKGQTLDANSRVFIRDGDRCWFIQIGTIELIVGEGNHARVYFAGQSALILRSLSALEQRLPSDLFIRANRGELINMGFIASVEPWFSQCLKATLKSGRSVEFSRRASHEFRLRNGL